MFPNKLVSGLSRLGGSRSLLCQCAVCCRNCVCISPSRFFSVATEISDAVWIRGKKRGKKLTVKQKSFKMLKLPILMKLISAKKDDRVVMCCLVGTTRTQRAPENQGRTPKQKSFCFDLWRRTPKSWIQVASPHPLQPKMQNRAKPAKLLQHVLHRQKEVKPKTMHIQTQ